MSLRDIGEAVGCRHSGIHVVFRGGQARDATRRPKRAKLDQGPLCDKVTEWLRALWSPEEITNRLLLDYPDGPGMRVSHETIYQCL
jgi:IS30 family transposase